MVILLDHLPDLQDTELLDDRDLDVVDLSQPVEVLFSRKDLLNEVFIIITLLWKVVLTLLENKIRVNM